MISLSAAVTVVLYLLIGGLIFGLLFWLIGYVAQQAPFFQPFAGVARIVLVVLAVLVLIGFLLSFVNDKPLFRP